MLSLTNNKLSHQRFFAGAALFVLIANLIIGGILLPYKNAQAVGAIVHDPDNFAQNLAKWIWDKVQSAYHAAASWTSAAVDLWQKQISIVKEALKVAWDRMRRMMLNMLVNDIVKWVQGGGKPRFVTNWKDFLETAADKALGQFVTQDLGGAFLCGPFAVTLQIALAAPATFDESVKCTISDIVENIDDFFADFSNGGWAAWISVSEPNNNVFGADLMALDRKYDLIAQAQEAAKNEALAGDGFTDDTVCVKMTPSGSNTPIPGRWRREEMPLDASCLQWETVTSGKIISEALTQAVNVDIPWLINSKEFSEYAGAIIDAVINRVLREGITALASSGEGTSDSATGPGITTPAIVSINDSPYTDALVGKAAIDSLIPQERLLKENMNKTLGEYQKNLDVLNQIQTTQENIILLLQQTSNIGCSLPAGCSLGPGNSTAQNNCDTTCPCESITTTTQPFTIGGLGSGALQRIFTNRYVQMATEGNPVAACDSLVFSSTESSIINSALSSTDQIIATRTEMQTLQTQAVQMDAVITDSVAYQIASQAYIENYEALLGDPDIQTNTSLTQETMEAAKIQVLASLKALTQNQSNNISNHLSFVMDLSQAVVQKNSELQTQRGYSADCSFVEINTYYGTLCAVQIKETEIEDNYNYCSEND